MTIEEFGQGYALLVSAYQRQLRELDDEARKAQRKLYYTMLKDMDGTLWEEVVNVAIKSSQWFPTVAELIRYGAELSRLRGGGDPADQAFELALREVKRIDYHTRRPLSPVRNDVEAIVRALGGWGRLALVEEHELGWYRKEFIAAWKGRYDIISRLVATGAGMLGAGDEQTTTTPALGAGDPAQPADDLSLEGGA